MEFLRSLFSFRGEIGRGAFWGTLISLSLIDAVLECSIVLAGAHIGETIFDPMSQPLWPHSPATTALFVIFWLFETAFMWITVAALAKRLRDVGIALKWLGVFVPLFALFSAAVWVFAPAGMAEVSLGGLAAIVAIGLPTCAIGFWLFGSALFAPGGKPRYFDPAQLPEGWKK